MIDLVNDEDRREIKNILENDLISMTNLCKHYGVRAKKMRTVCKQHNISPIAIQNIFGLSNSRVIIQLNELMEDL